MSEHVCCAEGVREEVKELRGEVGAMRAELSVVKDQLSWRNKLLIVIGGLLGAIGTALAGGSCTPAYAERPEAAAARTVTTTTSVGRRLPIRVAVQPGLEAAREAVDFWNDAIGCPVFTHAKPGGGVDLRVVRRSANKNYVGYYNAPLRRIEMYEPGLQDETIAFWIAAHELGHALGLRHVELDEDSLMYPYVVRKHMGTWDQYANHPTVGEFLPMLRLRFCE